MAPDLLPTSSSRQLPTLSQYCHRVVAKNIDCASIIELMPRNATHLIFPAPPAAAVAAAVLDGVDDVPYRVLKPVLDACTPQSLLRLERKAPHIALEDEEVWHALCVRDFAQELDADDFREPASWRDCYQELQEDAESRIEQAASRMRSLRDEERAHKRARQIVLTDKTPPRKRPFRGGASFSRPKTLFEKTRKDAQKASLAKAQAVPAPQPPRSATIAFEPRPAPSSSSSSSSARTVLTGKPQDAAHRPVSSSLSPQAASPPPPPPPPKPKKNPMASLFMPKHRAYSQLTK